MSTEVVEAARRFLTALDNERAFSRDWHELIGSDGKQRGDDRTTMWRRRPSESLGLGLLKGNPEIGPERAFGPRPRPSVLIIRIRG